MVVGVVVWMCVTFLVCVGDRCVNTCTTTLDCPGDGTCLDAPGTGLSFCFAPGRDDAGTGDDAAGLDAAADDASQSDAGMACSGASCARALCVGSGFACAIQSGHAYCWGANELGQLGDGDAFGMAHDHVDDCGGDDCSAAPV